MGTAGTANRFAAFSDRAVRSEEHTSELQSQSNLVCRLLLEKKKLPVAPSRYEALSYRLSPARRCDPACRSCALESMQQTACLQKLLVLCKRAVSLDTSKRDA